MPELGFAPDLDAIDADALRRARLMFFNYPNNPTGRDPCPTGCSSARSSCARAHDILAVHDNAYSETTYDGYVAPSFLATPGAKEVGVEVFSLSKGYNMTGWRCAAIVGNAEAIAQYWRLKSNIDSGLFEAVQLAGRRGAGARRSTPTCRAMNAVYARRRDLVCDALAQAGVDGHAAEGHDLHLGAGARRASRRSAAYCEHVLEQAAVVISPGGAYGPQRRGVLPDLADDARRPAARGRRAAASPLSALEGERPLRR